MGGKEVATKVVDATGVVSWVHIGDLHMTLAGKQNDLDLQAIVQKINRVFAGSIDFVFLPGDVAEHGNREAYGVVRHALDQLSVPWHAIIGDHDVHEKTFAPFLESMSQQMHYAFTVGRVRFLAMNAFDVPEPPSFTVSEEQLAWLRAELQQATEFGQMKVLLLHCYPSDLKVGREALTALIREFDVKVVDMGHTHYNEISNDGATLYAATRSTGQIEEGPVGFSVTNIDGEVISWRFVELDELPVVIITSPADEWLRTDHASAMSGEVVVRAKVWAEAAVGSVVAHLGSKSVEMERLPDSHVWQGAFEESSAAKTLRVVVRTAEGGVVEDSIRIAGSSSQKPARADRDQDNAIGAWPEHGLLGTQLGPNKNGKKW